VQIAGGKFLIVGGASLIGSHLARQLLDDQAAEVVLFDNLSLGSSSVLAALGREDRVSVVRGDVLRLPMLMDAMRDVDGAFALAAYLSLPLARDPALGVEVNAMGAVNMLEAARLLGRKKVVLASSIAVYGNEVDGLVDEATSFRSAGTSAAFATYAASKLLGESLGRLYAQKYDVPTCSARFSTVYGENQHERGVNALYILEALQAVREGRRPTIRGDGTEAHDYLHAGDAARGLVAAMRRGTAGEAYNVVSGKSTTVNEIVDMVLAEYGSTLAPQKIEDARTTRSTAHAELLISNQKAREELGWEPQVDVANGIHRLRRWLDEASAQ
jgi:UDP-glucose 4-epimerase